MLIAENLQKEESRKLTLSIIITRHQPTDNILLNFLQIFSHVVLHGWVYTMHKILPNIVRSISHILA